MWLLCVLAKTTTIDAKTIAYNLDTHQFSTSGKARVKQKDYTLTGHDVIMDDTFKNVSARDLDVEKDKIHYFLAERGEKNAHLFTFDDAEFSSCKGCRAKNPGKPKTWSVHSKKITYDVGKKRVYHNAATLYMGRLPVFWSPYFSHPDFSVPYQKGFFFPQADIVKEFGVTMGLPYYYPFDGYTDLKLTPFITSQKKVAVAAVAQKLVRNGYSKIDTALFPHHECEGHFFWTNRYDFFDNTRINIDIKHVSSLDYMNRFWWMHGKKLFHYEPLTSQISASHWYDGGLALFKNYWIQFNQKRKNFMPNWTWEHDIDVAGGTLRSFHHFLDENNFTHALAFEKHTHLTCGLQVMTHIQERIINNHLSKNNKTEFIPKGIVRLSWPLLHQKHPWILTPIVQLMITRPMEMNSFDGHNYNTLMTQSFYDTSPSKTRLTIGGSFVTPKSYTEWFADIQQKKSEHDIYFVSRNSTYLTPAIQFNVQSAWSQKHRNCCYMENGLSFFQNRNAIYLGFIQIPQEPAHVHANGSVILSEVLSLQGGYIGNIEKTRAYYSALHFENECFSWEAGMIHRFIRSHKTNERLKDFGVFFRFNIKFQKDDIPVSSPHLPLSPLSVFGTGARAW